MGGRLGKDRSGMRRLPWEWQKKQEEKWWNFLEKVEQSGKWPQQAYPLVGSYDGS